MSHYSLNTEQRMSIESLREMGQITSKGKTIRITDLSIETLKTRRA
jgi:hypothetical protein